VPPGAAYGAGMHKPLAMNKTLAEQLLHELRATRGRSTWRGQQRRRRLFGRA